MSGNNQSEVQKRLNSAFERINKALGCPYTSAHLQPLQDLVSHHIVYNDNTLNQKYPASRALRYNSDRAELIALNFITSFADEIWPHRQRGTSAEDELRKSVEAFILLLMGSKVTESQTQNSSGPLIATLRVESAEENEAKEEKEQMVLGWMQGVGAEGSGEQEVAEENLGELVDGEVMNEKAGSAENGS